MDPIKSVKDYFEKVVVPTMRTLFMAMFGPAPSDSLPPGEPPPESNGHPYRASGPPPAAEREIVVTCETRGDADRDKKTVEAIKVRTKRRAIRYFKGLDRPEKGKEVKHRVTDRKPDEIEFGYFRGSGKPLHVRWRKEPHAEIQDQK
jgi:hypothetical protein